MGYSRTNDSGSNAGMKERQLRDLMLEVIEQLQLQTKQMVIRVESRE